MSLIEATIILAVASMLAAVLAPSVRNYTLSAQQAAAKADVEAIASAITRMLADVGETSIMQDGNGAAVTDPPSHAAANGVDLLVSDGNIPTVQTAETGPGTTDWNSAVNDAAIQTLEHYLVVNTPSNLPANRYRAAADMSVGFDPATGGTFNSEFAWRGAYLPGPLGPDPWGYRYAVNVEYLERPLGAGPAGNVNDVVVLSSGNNGIVETRYNTDGFTSVNDVVALVSGGTR
jgi:Tfp pilus assembly protein PilE